MKKHVILLILCPLVLFAQHKHHEKLTYISNSPKDSIPVHLQSIETSGFMNDDYIAEFPFRTILPLNADSMIALFKNKALDFSKDTKFSYVNSSLHQNNNILGVGQDATYTLMQVPYSAGARYSTSGDLIRWTRALHNNNYVDLTDSQKRGEERFGTPWLYFGH